MELSNETSPLISGAGDNTYNEGINRSVHSLDSTGKEAVQLQSQSKHNIRTYKTRWYILFIVTLIDFVQCYFVNTWAVIAVSVQPVFGWSNAEISLMLSWYCFMYFVFIFPITWLTETKGLRWPVVITCAFLFGATILRSISMSPPAVTWLNNLACLLIGAAEPVAYASAPVVSAVWFPPEQRTTTTSIILSLGYLGYGVCYIFGTLFVSVPIEIHNHNSSIRGDIQYSNLGQIRDQIRTARLIECGICGLLLLSVVIYFPNKPPTPPSLTSALPKLKFFKGVKTIIKTASKDFWLVLLVYAISSAIYSTWIGLLTVNFGAFIPQVQIGYLGFVANLVGTITAMVAGRFADVFMARMKPIVVVLMSVAIISTFWILLFAMQYVRMSKAQLFTAVLIQAIAVEAPIGIYYELCCELNYPIHEIVTAGAIVLVYNIFPVIFLFVFFIPGIGVSWMNWFMFGSLLLCFPLILSFKENYKRLNIDTRQPQINTDENTETQSNINT